ncbi:DUF1704 domain-containing protein [Sphingorhabdus soli]|uniref:DUF1704 domain-containing protein n=1 Tax=Flavisphingopyxis soli TaxID=2601267 RepID=A0A5C6U793_9SPHN|nr:tyrosine/phenylalanine carboxypeptidase domain-containing protein [Sphingorhabdus soli]TXC67706.1 DUF1704 domain-containing protein [Sphingorhabdus soli]
MLSDSATEPGDAGANDAFIPEFGPTGALRQGCGCEGRIHIDRPLPFLVLNRFDPEHPDSLAKRIAVTSSAYAVWPEGIDDAAALEAIDAVLRHQAESCERILLISVHDREPAEQVLAKAAKLPEFTATISSSEDIAARAAADTLAATLAKVKVDLRHCTIERDKPQHWEPGIEAIVAGDPRFSHLSLALPQNYQRPDGNGIYPQLFHDLSIEIFDALLKAAKAFMAAAGEAAPQHHRALGRSSFIDAAKSADGKLDEICRSYDFLLSVSPINTEKAFAKFSESGFEETPKFRYRPLTVDPDLAKRALYAIDLKSVEAPMLENLFSEKRQEVDYQLTMLAARNTPNFRHASMLLYGTVERDLRDSAIDILASKRPKSDSDGGSVDCYAVERGARTLVGAYRAQDDRFDVAVELREDIAAGLMVSGNKVLISTATNMPAHRLEPLLHHEISIHALTWVNGAQQGLAMFRTGLAQYEGVQEGLGVFAEWAVGGLTWARLRALAARVVGVDAMIAGASFVECFRLLHDTHGFSARGAFNITARIYRSGGFAKDVIYLRGFKTVLDLIAAGGDLTPYWYGKIAPQHIAVIEEFALRGLLRKPLFTPAFLTRDDVRDRIAAFRQNPSLSSLL